MATKKNYVLWLAMLGLFNGISGRAKAELIFYSSVSSFASANPGLSTETFESALVPNGQSQEVPGPLSSTMSYGNFPVGGLLPGFSITSPGTAEGLLAIFGTGAIPGASKLVGNPTPGSALEIAFGPQETAVGMNLIASAAPGQVNSDTFLVSIYGASGLLSAQQVDVAGISTYFGVSSDSDLITRINIRSFAGGTELMDNLSFTAAIPEPSSLILAGIAGAMVAGVVRARRKSTVA